MSFTCKEPKLRFFEFSGEWVEKKLGEVVTSKSGKYNPEKEKISFKCIELEHLASETGALLGYTDSINSGSMKNKFEKGDVLFGKLRPYLKKYLQTPFEGVCSSEIWVLKGISISNNFLYRIIQTDSFIELANQSSGSKMPRADWDVVSNGIFAFPSKPEQEKIASFLTAVDAKIEQLTCKEKLLEKYKKSAMQKLFSQELRFTCKDGSEYSEWEEKKLGDIGKVSMCKRIMKDQTTSEGEIPFYKIGTFGKQADAYISQELYETYQNKFSFPKKGDILISASGTIGRTVVYDGLPAYFQDSNIVWIDNNEKLVKNTFLFYCYKNITWNTEDTTIARLYNDNLRNVKILVPSLPEQTKIADFLSAIDEKCLHVKHQLEQTKQFKKALLQQMFV